MGEFFYFRFFYKTPVIIEAYEFRGLLIGGGEALPEIANRFRKIYPDKVAEKIKEADIICQHIFDLLGSGPTKLGKEGDGYQPIDWHSDFKSGYRWDNQMFYKRIKYGHIKGVDIKVPWELSRFQHLNTLGQAYALTDDKKYREEFVSQVEDWLEANPIGLGVNWACTMDVAIRAANLLVAKEFFEESALPKEFLEKFYASICKHGWFIRNHLEYSSSLTTNHYIADLAGLFFIAVYCPFFRDSASWRKFCVNELTKEIQKQVYEDGCNFEASTSYHRLVLEMFFYCELLGKRAGVEFPQAYRDKVRKMFVFSLYCIKPNGKIPQIGDNDSGRFMILSSRPILEHKYLLSLAAIYYGDSIFKRSEFSFDEEAFWVFGVQGQATFEQLPLRSEPLKSRAFPDAGWYIMRDNKDYCFISCGPNGQNGRGGHAHNDKLSFELMLDGHDVIVDPGTYLYTPCPGSRSKFRSTAVHNTIQIDGMEQNCMTKNLFKMEQGVNCAPLNFEEKDGKVVFEGEAEYLGERLNHRRRFVLSNTEGRFYIIDKITSDKPHNFLFNLCLNNKPLYGIESENTVLSETKGAYSAEYGKKEEALFLRAATNEKSDFTHTIVIAKDREKV